jgi:TatD DNase family protein
MYDISYYRALAQSPKVVAIGECGLDYFRPTEVNDEVKKKQKEIFKKQIELAAERGLPLIIHARPSKGTQDAYHDVIAILQEAKKTYSNLRGDSHFFVGGEAEAMALTALDFTVSFTAVITFARDYDAVIRSVPLTSILAETDAPYVAPISRRGQRNDPFAVIDVAAKLAEVRGEDLETVRTALLENTKGLFGI